VKNGHIDLFSGIGGFALGARANGLTTEVFCEVEKDCQEFLKECWQVPVVKDVRKFDGRKWTGRFLLTAGVPCQPASRAGKQRGADDDRWLWPEALRITAEARPRWALFENPPGIYDVGFDGIISELESIGYEVGIIEIPACAVNSPQRRNRVWIVASSSKQEIPARGDTLIDADQHCELADCAEQRSQRSDSEISQGRSFSASEYDTSHNVASTSMQYGGEQGCEALDGGRDFANAWNSFEWIYCGDGKIRRAKPGICGVAHGVSRGLLRALGNAIVPQVSAKIIKAIIQAENEG